MKTRRWFFLILTILSISIVVVIVIACGKVDNSKSHPIRIGISPWPGYVYAFIAQEKGFFKKNAVDVQLVLKEEISEVENCYRNEEVDGLFTVFSNVFQINAGGIKTKIVCISDYSTTGDVIIAKPDISSVTDLKGKVVSFEGVNSFSHIFVLTALEKSGLPEEEVNFKNISAQDVPEALERGIISAGHTWNPAKAELVKKGYKVIATAADYDYVIIDVLAFNSKIISSRPDEIKAIVNSLFEAVDFMKENRDEAIKIMAEATGMSIEDMTDGLEGTVIVDLKENDSFMNGFGTDESFSKNAESISYFLFSRGQEEEIPNINNLVAREFINELSGKAQ